MNLLNFLDPRLVKVTIAALLAAVTCSGCLSFELNTGHYLFHYNAGLDALDSESYFAAKREFGRAILYSQVAKLGPEAEAAAIYNYAFAVGHLGDFGQAEECFKMAMALDAKCEGVDGPHASMRWFELARLYQAWGKYELSCQAYEKAIPLAEEYGAEKQDPIVFAEVLNDFSVALIKCNRESVAESAKARAEAIKAANPGASPKMKLHYYPLTFPEPSSFVSPPVEFQQNYHRSWPTIVVQIFHENPVGCLSSVEANRI